ncbi:ATP-binding protein [Streptomyces sp. NPDC056132]|uniref:ATP-binding protein n=1 Tax=Streptomyces sp. NPDC056132 TaxID=3345722 RepID=UPI0035E2CE63
MNIWEEDGRTRDGRVSGYVGGDLRMSGNGDAGADHMVCDDESRHVVADGVPRSTTVLGGDEPIAAARDLVRAFLAEVQTVHGLSVSSRTVGTALLVVSELVTNAYKYAPGSCLLDLRVAEGVVEICVWDSEPTLPVVHPWDPGRVGQHGLEIVKSVSRSFDVRRESAGKRVTVTLDLGEPAARLD